MSEQHVVCEGATVYCSLSMTNNSPATAIPLTITSQTLAVANGSKKIATNKDNTVINMCLVYAMIPEFSLHLLNLLAWQM